MGFWNRAGRPWGRGTGRVGALSLAALVGLSTAACSPNMDFGKKFFAIQFGQFPERDLVEMQLFAFDEAGGAFTTMHDFDTAKDGAYAGLGAMEGMHLLYPDSPEGLAMLVRSWCGVAFGFIGDEMEEAMIAEDDAMVAYHRARATSAFKRANFFALELLAMRAPGWKGATKNAATLRTWLKANFTTDEYLEELLYMAFSYLGQAAFNSEDPTKVADVWIGVEVLEHVVRIDESVLNAQAHLILGAYHSSSAFSDLSQAKGHFDRALKLTGGKILTVQMSLARYYCLRHDEKAWRSTLEEILASGDEMQAERLPNLIAKRRARRYLDHEVFQEDCGFELQR